MRITLAGLPLSLVWALAHAQQAPPTIVRTTTRLVQVSVKATRGNKPARGLTQADFEITDNGKPQKLVSFDITESATTQSVPSLPEGVFTNRGASPGAAVVLLFDALNNRFLDRAHVRDQMLRYLRSIGPDARVGIYGLGREVRVLHEFGHPLGQDLARLEKQQDWAKLLSEDLQSWLSQESANPRLAPMIGTQRLEGTARGIEAIARHLARVPGRKSLIWLSSGFPWLGLGEGNTTSPTFDPIFTDTIRAINAANLAIYTVDAAGLRPDVEFPAQKGGRAADRRLSASQTDTLFEIAYSTGGKPYHNTNDLAQAIRDAVEDSELIYVLGYYPTGDPSDGKFHAISVKTRAPGISLRYRNSYYRVPEPTRDDTWRKQELQAAATNPLDATELGITAKVVRVAQGWEITLRMDPKGIDLSQEGDRWFGDLDVIFLQRSAEGPWKNGVDDRITLRLSEERYRQVASSGIAYRQLVQAAAGTAELRAIVRDARSGAVGAVTMTAGKPPDASRPENR